MRVRFSEVSELMETDLASILKSSQPISDAHCQFFLYQILRGVKFMHSAEVRTYTHSRYGLYGPFFWYKILLRSKGPFVVCFLFVDIRIFAG